MRKHILLSLLAGLFFIFTGCENTNVWEDEQYMKQAYLIGIGEEGALVNRTISYTDEEAEIFAAVAVSGSLDSDKDIHCVLVEEPSGIDIYNSKYKSSMDIQYRPLPAASYSIASLEAVVLAGETGARIPVKINPAGLHCDSLYAIALKMASCAEYPIASPETVVLFAINTSNDYSGHYNYTGTNNGISFSYIRTAVAVNKNTIRIYHSGNEDLSRVDDTGLTITVNADNTLSLAGWKNLNVTNASGTFDPDDGMFRFECEINGSKVEASLSIATSGTN